MDFDSKDCLVTRLQQVVRSLLPYVPEGNADAQKRKENALNVLSEEFVQSCEERYNKFKKREQWQPIDKTLKTTANSIRKDVIGQLKSCIDTHGPITMKYLESAAKRVTYQVAAHLMRKGYNIKDEE
jgi:hypothetical protein